MSIIEKNTFIHFQEAPVVERLHRRFTHCTTFDTSCFSDFEDNCSIYSKSDSVSSLNQILRSGSNISVANSTCSTEGSPRSCLNAKVSKGCENVNTESQILIIRNFPWKYTLEQFQQELRMENVACDKVFLPIGQKQKNLGYAFIQCVSEAEAERCIEIFEGRTWSFTAKSLQKGQCGSSKRAEAAYATLDKEPQWVTMG